MQSDSLQVTIPLHTANNSLILSKDGMFSTIQGEGPRMGRPTTFMRLGGCNLACSWCDTAYTWDWANYNPRVELVPQPIPDIADRIIADHTTSLTITGGEPFSQSKGLQNLFKFLISRRYVLDEINFETNGTICPEWDARTWGAATDWGIVISPKLSNSGNGILTGPVEAIIARTETLIHWLMLEERQDNIEIDFKFVCESTRDFHEIDHIRELVGASDHSILADHLWVMPEGTTPEVLTSKAQEMADEIISRGWNLTTRLHQYIWGNARAK